MRLHMKALKSSRYVIPNGITAANVICGFLSILAASENQFIPAAWLIIAAGIFDLFDGRVARLFNATSRFGEEFDTLSDFLSFGIAPAFLYYQYLFREMGILGATLAIVYLLSVAFRLARFAMNTGKPSTGFFQGLSSPVSACTGVSFVLFTSPGNGGHSIPETHLGPEFAVFLILGLALLMVSNLRFPSFKSTNWRSPRGILALICLCILIGVALKNPRQFVFPILLGLLALVMIADVSSRVRMLVRR